MSSCNCDGSEGQGKKCAGKYNACAWEEGVESGFFFDIRYKKYDITIQIDVLHVTKSKKKRTKYRLVLFHYVLYE